MLGKLLGSIAHSLLHVALNAVGRGLDDKVQADESFLCINSRAAARGPNPDGLLGSSSIALLGPDVLNVALKHQQIKLGPVLPSS